MSQLQESKLEKVKINIATLPSMPFTDLVRLPNIRGVYFALDDQGRVLYIGQTVSLTRRWMGHGKLPEISESGCTRIAWLCSSGNLRHLESVFIRQFKPPLNTERSQRSSGKMMIGEVMLKYRQSKGLGVREVALQIGISHGTLSRVERGEKMEGDTLAKMLRWLLAANRKEHE